MTIENPPGMPLHKPCDSYGFEGHLKNHGGGYNQLRTDRLAQPGALRIGDILATGDQVLSNPREGGNGSVLLHLTGGMRGHWVGVPGRIPIALLTPEDNPPSQLWNYHKENNPR